MLLFADDYGWQSGLADVPSPRYFLSVSTVQEIKNAIQALSPQEREELAACLPALLPELDGDAAWARITRDPRPRPALEKLLDEVEAEHGIHPEKFRETSEAEFERNS